MNNAPLLDEIDKEILKCLDLANPKSFFLFAGAGSGKTGSLVRILQAFRASNAQRFKMSGKRVAIITYTNAACDEIQRRLEYDTIFNVSTLHSFAWEVIQTYQQDIREWLRTKLEADITDLKEKQAKGRPSKASEERRIQIETKTRRLHSLDAIKKFNYNPNGTNSEKDSLSHDEVIRIAAHFATEYPLMRRILISRYPVLLIDESQDTQEVLIDAFLNVQRAHSEEFCIGLFGDMMQRIYGHGKYRLDFAIPDDWQRPAKRINYRCPSRVIELINKVRAKIDGHQQELSGSKEVGTIRLFLAPLSNDNDKSRIELAVASQMATCSGDKEWAGTESDVKVLILEHRMAARRGGFDHFFGPLHSQDELKTGVVDGTLSGVSFLIKQVIPLVEARRAGNEFLVAQVMREHSPILSKTRLRECENPIRQIEQANTAVEEFYALYERDTDIALIELLRKIAELGLFVIPDSLKPIVLRPVEIKNDSEPSEEEELDRSEVLTAWDTALSAPFSQLKSYNAYISDKSRFGTHQGVKGLEFPRVMVIIDDDEAKHFLFKYGKILGVEPASSTDIQNEADGKDTAQARALRLFYVTCSRAEKSLAVVVYTGHADRVRRYVVDQGWFNEDEIISL